MPIYAWSTDLKKKLAAVQAKGEIITSVTHADGEWVVVTELPDDTTGRPHLPSFETWDRVMSEYGVLLYLSKDMVADVDVDVPRYLELQLARVLWKDNVRAVGDVTWDWNDLDREEMRFMWPVPLDDDGEPVEGGEPYPPHQWMVRGLVDAEPIA